MAAHEVNEIAASDNRSLSRSLFLLFGLIMVPVFVGAVVGRRFSAATNDFYSATAQVIATLFVAVAIEFFARQASQKKATDGIQVLVLIGISWAGLFACIRALAGGGSSLTAGCAGAGVTAASVLLSLALYEQIERSRPGSDRASFTAAVVVVLFLAAPVSLLMFR